MARMPVEFDHAGLGVGLHVGQGFGFRKNLANVDREIFECWSRHKNIEQTGATQYDTPHCLATAQAKWNA